MLGEQSCRRCATLVISNMIVIVMAQPFKQSQYLCILIRNMFDERILSHIFCHTKSNCWNIKLLAYNMLYVIIICYMWGEYSLYNDANILYDMGENIPCRLVWFNMDNSTLPLPGRVGSLIPGHAKNYISDYFPINNNKVYSRHVQYNCLQMYNTRTKFLKLICH